MGDIIANSLSTNSISTSTVVVAGLATLSGGVSTTTISTNTLNAGYVITRLPNNTSAIASVSPLAVTNGNAYLSFSPQIEFQYNTGGYKHFMGSRHDGNKVSSFGNAIDFWLYSASSGGNTASTTPGTCNVNTLSVTAQGVGIFNDSPLFALDVVGSTRLQGGLSTTTISTGSITATNFYGNGSGLTGISGGSANLTISNVTGTALLQTGTTPTITSTASGTYYVLTNSGFSNIYIYDYLSSGTYNGYYTVLVNQTGTSLTVATTNLNITPSGFLTIPADTNMTLAYSPSNGYAGYIIM